MRVRVRVCLLVGNSKTSKLSKLIEALYVEDEPLYVEDEAFFFHDEALYVQV